MDRGKFALILRKQARDINSQISLLLCHHSKSIQCAFKGMRACTHMDRTALL